MRNHEIPQLAQEHREAVEQALEHFDGLGMPEDDYRRKLVSISLACTSSPSLRVLMMEMYPDRRPLMN